MRVEQSVHVKVAYACEETPVVTHAFGESIHTCSSGTMIHVQRDIQTCMQTPVEEDS